MVKLIPFFLLTIVYFDVKGIHKLEWYDGVITLNSGKEYSGSINYNTELDIVSYLDQGNIKAFSASKVRSFEFFDTIIEEKRRFISYDFLSGTSNYKTKVFFEIILSGKMMLLRRYRSFNQFYSLLADSLTDNFGSFIYYAFCEGRYINLKSFKQQLMPLLIKEHPSEINAFIEINTLKIRDLEDQVLIIDYYNYLTDHTRKSLATDYLYSIK